MHKQKNFCACAAPPYHHPLAIENRTASGRSVAGAGVVEWGIAAQRGSAAARFHALMRRSLHRPQLNALATTGGVAKRVRNWRSAGRRPTRRTVVWAALRACLATSSPGHDSPSNSRARPNPARPFACKSMAQRMPYGSVQPNVHAKRAATGRRKGTLTIESEFPKRAMRFFGMAAGKGAD